jgi:hypothetical protein
VIWFAQEIKAKIKNSEENLDREKEIFPLSSTFFLISGGLSSLDIV